MQMTGVQKEEMGLTINLQKTKYMDLKTRLTNSGILKMLGICKGERTEIRILDLLYCKIMTLLLK
jgi:hypothetical protein